jgi:IS605 OrfB family transposase
MPTKCVKVYITYNNENKIPYADMCKELWELQKQIRAAKNKAVSAIYQNLMWKMEQKKITGEYPDEKEKYGCKLGQHIYALMRQEAPDIQTSDISTSQQILTQKVKKSAKEILRGDKSLECFKSNQPIEIHNKSIRIVDDEGKIGIGLSLFSTEKRTSLGMKNGILWFTAWKPGDSQKAILDRCASGEYRHGAGALKYDQKKQMWVLSVTYSFEAQQKDLDPEKICGVDLGISSPVYCATNKGYERMNYPGGRVESFRKQVERRKRQILRSGPFVGKGGRGHGYKRRVEAAKSISDRIARFRDTENDIISRSVVDFSLKNGCGVIQMENLSGIGELSVFLKNWAYYDLQSKIEQKANEAGIVVRKINPKYTSQRCHKCGHISAGNRKTQADFVCEKCGYSTNADFNAAKNISLKDIEQVVKTSLSTNRKQTA